MKRILTFLLALVLSIGCTFSLTAFANETAPEASDAKKPEIISQNVMYGGDFSLMFAVRASSVSGSNITLSVYDEEPTEASEALWSKTVSATVATADVKGIASYVFTTPGVAAKDMDKNFYIVAESAGVKSEVKRYSVAEYLYERLYDDYVIAGTSALEVAQTKLYKSALEVGKNAQNLLFNFDSDPTNDRTTFVTDLYYVSFRDSKYPAVGATLNGEKYSTALMTSDEVVTLLTDFNHVYTVYDWNVKAIDDDGNVSTSTAIGVSGTKPTSHLIISPNTYSKLPNTYDLDSVESIDSAVIRTTVSATTQVSLENGAAKISLLGTGNGKPGYYEVVSNVMTKVAGSEKLVYEADVVLPEDGAGTFYYHFRSSTYTYQFKINMSGDKYVLTDNLSNASKTIDAEPFHIRFEYYMINVGGANKYVVDTYINGEYYEKSKTAYGNVTEGVGEPSSITHLYCVFPSALPEGTTVYFDNISFAQLSPIEIPEEEFVTFDDSDTINSHVLSSNSYADVSLVQSGSGNALNVHWATKGDGTVTFYPITVEENADKVIFEYTFTNYYAKTYLIRFFNGSTRIYDFQFNNGVTLTSESNNVSWGTLPKVGETYTIRFELWMNGEDLEIDVYLNEVKGNKSNKYGTVVTLKGVGADYLTKLTRVVISDSVPNVEGDIVIDNVRFSKLNTSN